MQLLPKSVATHKYIKTVHFSVTVKQLFYFMNDIQYRGDEKNNYNSRRSILKKDETSMGSARTDSYIFKVEEIQRYGELKNFYLL
jgi:hypothetical protein